ncbi:unnamed protein product, partial [Laminaria digitata]
ALACAVDEESKQDNWGRGGSNECICAVASSKGLRNLCSAQLNHSTTSGQSGTTTTEQ